jgi:hypothetical protein
VLRGLVVTELSGARRFAGAGADRNSSDGLEIYVVNWQ